MKRINVLKASFLLMIISSLLFTGCTSMGNKAKEPNFVWIISEDNSKHYLKLFDPNGIGTPNIERMAENGITFTRAFSNAPVCSVARSSLISSCYAPRTGAQFHRKIEEVNMPEDVRMFPAYLRDAGYYTTNNSKEDYNFRKASDVWDESSKEAHWTNREKGQPFFHKESHGVSHEGRLHFSAELMETYEPVTDPAEVHVFPNHPDTELFRFTGAYYRDKMLAVDSIVGRVISQLEEAGELENTFVFYFGDHGGVLPGSKGYAYETGLHIPLVVRVPENFRHLADMKRGSFSKGFVSFVDFGPTLLELAGIEIPLGVDGKPFLGRKVSANEVEQRDVVFGYADRFDEKYDQVRTARKGAYKYIRSYQPFNFDGLQNNYRYKCLAYQQWREMYENGELNEVQSQFFKAREPEALYDLENDPYETVNLAGDPAYTEKLLEMRELLTGWVKGMPDLSFFPEYVLLRKAFKEYPARFGQEFRQACTELVDLADLSLLPYEEARDRIGDALYVDQEAPHYWGLIACSSFGEEASEYTGIARQLTRSGDLLVRVRAAEFLGLIGEEDPVPVMVDALNSSTEAAEALLILNCLVLMIDGPHKYYLDVADIKLDPSITDDLYIKWRMEYLHSREG